MRHVWSPASGAHHTATSRKKSQQAGISAERCHTGYLDTRLAPNLLLIHVGKQHMEHLMAVLQEHYKISSNWKGKNTLVWISIGTKKTHSAHVDARICGRSPHHIPSQTPLQATGSALPVHQSKLWSEGLVC